MILTRRYNFDIVPGGPPLLIRASRNDTSSTLVFSLFAGEGVLQIPAGTTAVFRCPYGNAIATLSFVGGIPTITVDLTADMTGNAGWIPFEIVLTASQNEVDYTLVTATMILDIRG